jgi:hypothetical protein
VGGTDIFVSKFSPEGKLLWNFTFGGPSPNPFQDGDDKCVAIALDSSDSIFLTGNFLATVDFDPGPGIDNRTANGWFEDFFVSKYSPDGQYIGAQTWGGPDTDLPNDLAVGNDGKIWIAGAFAAAIDFDPGSGVDNHQSNGGHDSFLTCYSNDLAYQWTGTWGNTQDDDTAATVATSVDGSVYVGGRQHWKADFDPGPGVTWGCDNQHGGYLSKFDSEHNFQWVRVWGAFVDGIAAGPSGDVYILTPGGDMDPGPGEDKSSGSSSLIRISSNGAYTWGTSIKGASYKDIALDNLGNIYAVGDLNYSGVVDFDPGLGIDIHSGNGWHEFGDGFAVKYPPDLYW